MDAEGVGGGRIDGACLTAWGLLDGGTRVALAFASSDGTARQLSLPFDALSSLLMTLPRILQAALNARFPDGSLRVAQPLAHWKLEQNATTNGLILSLGTADGFEIAFSVAREDVTSLGTSLLGPAQTPGSAAATLN
jgi:hypothetical protein